MSQVDPKPTPGRAVSGFGSCPFAVIRRRHPDRLMRLDTGRSRSASPFVPPAESGLLHIGCEDYGKPTGRGQRRLAHRQARVRK
jgi:hypothetical protein